jgi:hypothetical protein
LEGLKNKYNEEKLREKTENKEVNKLPPKITNVTVRRKYQVKVIQCSKLD